YLVEYKAYTSTELTKNEIFYESEAAHKQFNQVISNLDGLIPVLLELLVKPDENGNKIGSLADLVYPLFVKDDIADLLVSTIVKLLAGLPADTITMVEGLVSDLANIKNTEDGNAFSIAPQTWVRDDNFGSKLNEYIGEAETWAEVWAAHSEDKKDENGNTVYVKDADGNIVKDADGNAVAEKVASAYAWGIADVEDFINLLCDFLAPLDCVLTLLLEGGMVREDFENGINAIKTLAVFDEIGISGGSGYNYAIVPLLELFGIVPMTQEEYMAAVAANKGSALYPILTTLFDRVDEILAAPIESVLDILANLCYVLGTGSLSTIVENLIAPVNCVIEKVDEIFPIAIPIDVGALINGGSLKVYLGEAHPGIDAGITFKLDGNDIAVLLEDLIAGISIGGATLSVDLDWLKLAASAGADADKNNKVDFVNSVMDPKWDIYNGEVYKNIKGDHGDTFVTLIKTVLTKANWDAISKALNINLGDFQGIVDGIIENPTKLIDLIGSIFSIEGVHYIPVQNRKVENKNVNYKTYLYMTEQNADIIAKNIDKLINNILSAAGFGSLKGLIGTLLTNDLASNLVGMITGLLGGGSVGGILSTISGLTTGEDAILVVDNGAGVVKPLGLDLSVQGYAAEYNAKNEDETFKYSNRNKAFGEELDRVANEGGTWADVNVAGINWGVNGSVTSFANALASILNPLNCVLELLLVGEGKSLALLPAKNDDGTYKIDDEGNVECVVRIKGGNGYDYAIIPLLEAFGLKAGEVKAVGAYNNAYNNDPAQLMGYILERVGYFADKLLNKPVDGLLSILPNLAYFIANEGVGLVVRNLVAPIYSILGLLGLDLMEMLNLNKLLGGINLGDLLGEILGAKFNLTLPEIDWMKLAQEGAADISEIATSRSQAANSFVNEQRIKNDAELKAYIGSYPVGYENVPHKTSQTFITADKGDVLTLVFTWLFELFENEKNQNALVDWIAEVLNLQAGAKETVRYAINQLFLKAQIYNAPDIIVGALFSALGVAVVIDAALMGGVAEVQKIFKDLFGAAGSGGCAYASIAKVMQDLTGVWDDTVGSDQDHEDAVEDAEESLNWFQKLIQKIKDFFAKIFSIFK
ncbi:MAG: hypothetical protein IIX36_05270, partial [Clostridia bacterium]|nr:hypothetical protein [Clostridia bacterium]